MAELASWLPNRLMPIPASPQNSSSLTMGIIRPDGSMKKLMVDSRP